MSHCRFFALSNLLFVNISFFIGSIWMFLVVNSIGHSRTAWRIGMFSSKRMAVSTQLREASASLPRSLPSPCSSRTESNTINPLIPYKKWFWFFDQLSLLFFLLSSVGEEEYRSIRVSTQDRLGPLHGREPYHADYHSILLIVIYSM